MYYQNYEDYMRQVLGYPINDSNIYEKYNYRDANTYSINRTQYNLTENEIMELYPESYNLIYPLVCRACETNNEPISKAILDKMTDEIYNIVEKNQTVVNVKIGIENRELEHNDNKKTENAQTTKLSARQELKQNTFHTNSKQEIIKENISKRTPTKFESKENMANRMSSSKSENTLNRFNSRDNSVNKTENRTITKETRQQNNPFLRDLIKILILQSLFGDGVIRPPRPNPPRPHYPPVRPPFPGERPPTGMNRMDIDYTEYL